MTQPSRNIAESTKMVEELANSTDTRATPIVAIVGRSNVGKSTLFNRLCKDRRALVDGTPGITRDRLIAQVSWGDRSFCLVDTGGIEDETRTPLETKVRQQAQLALEEADVVIFLADGKEGLHPSDGTVADILRRSGKPVLYAVNKIDGEEQQSALYEFYGLGVEKLFPVSAAHGYGVRDMLDTLVEMLPPQTLEEEKDAEGIRVAIIGRPNVGKSSLLNRILGSERVLVSDVPGTTRDAIDVSLTSNSQTYLLIDTPGIRRRSKSREKIEKFSVLKALKSIDRCQIAVLLLDGSKSISAQDVRIAGYIHERGRGAVVSINKWDLVEKDPGKVKEVSEVLAEALKFMPYAPHLRISALTGKRVSQLLPSVNAVFSQYSARVATPAVNDALAAAVSRHEPPMYGRRRVKILYGVQAATQPPTFVLFANYPEAIHFSYQRYLINHIRKAFSLDLTPVRLVFRRRGAGKGRRSRSITGIFLVIGLSPCRRLFVSAWSVLFVIFLLQSSCSEQAKEPQWTSPARIALVVPGFGPLQDEGEMLRQGALLALWEKRGRVADLEVEVAMYHSPCDVSEAVSIAERIAAESSISAVVGYLCAETIRAVFPVYNNADLALINPTISAEYIRKDKTRHLFPMLYGDKDQGAFLATYARKGLGLSRVAILTDGTTFGKLLRTSFLSKVHHLGIEVVADISIDPKPEEASQAVRLFKDAGPEAIFIAASAKAAGLFLLEKRQENLGGIVLGADHLADLDFYEMTGQAAEGLLLCQPALLDPEKSQNSEFIRRFERFSKRRPDWIAVAGYDAMRLVLRVLGNSGPERISFLRWMRQISTPETAFNGLSGPVFFEEDGSSLRPFWVAEIRNGRPRPAKPPTVEFPAALTGEK